MNSAELFETLSRIDISEHVESKNGLSYLSWAWAWITFKKYCPDATYIIKKFGEAQLPYVYDEKTGYMVYTEVTVGDLTYEMWLPVMDGANKAMKAEPYQYKVKNGKHRWAKQAENGKWYDKYGNEQPEYFIKDCEAADMFDVNKTIMRCLVKNLAIFGLGICLYAGEDLPQETPEEVAERKLKALDDKPLPTDQDFSNTLATAQKPQEEKPKKASAQQKNKILKMCEEQGKNMEKALVFYKVQSIDELSYDQATEIINILKKTAGNESTSDK